MLKKTITYDNLFTEKTVTEEHYFHISKADMVEMEMEEHKDEYTSKEGKKLTGAQAKLQRIVDSEDGKGIMAELKDMIRRSYGKKDGDRFLKSKAISDEFLGTEAFSQLLWDLCTEASAAGEFINGIFPNNLEKVAEEVQARAAQVGAQTLAESAETTPQDDPATLHNEGPSSREVVGTDPTGLTTETTPRVLTRFEMIEMDPDELKSGLATGRYKLS